MKKIATISALLVFAFVALPTKAQSVLALAAYDFDWEGLSIGAGFEYPINLELGPIGNTAIRPSAEYVFAGSGNSGGRAGDYSVFRVSGELVGSLNRGGDSAFRSHGQLDGSQFEPFLKAGLAFERFSFDFDSDIPIVGGTSFSNSEVGLVVGGGANIQSFFLEGTLGIGNISTIRIGGGYRFGIGGE